MGNSVPSEYIEVILFPKDSVKMSEFTHVLNAINSEYRQWLRDHKNLDHNDQGLRLFAQKVVDGDTVVWLVKSKDTLSNNLQEFYESHISKIINDLIKNAIVKPSSGLIKSIQNIKTIVCWKMKFNYSSPARKIEISNDISWDSRDKLQKNAKNLLADKDTIKAKNTIIKFISFRKNGNAQIIASRYSDDPIKTFLDKDVHDFFLTENLNFLHPSKEYLVNLEVTYKSNIIESYYITKVLGV